MKTAVIIACRMKSTRLPGKAMLKISGKTSIERCIEHAQRFPADEVILATSRLNEDNPLIDEASRLGVDVMWGDPDNLFDRYIEAADRYKTDTFFRLSGDCPVACPAIASELLASHRKAEADFTEAIHFATGTSCQVIQTAALKKLWELVPNPRYSEHMGLYFSNNPHIFKINRIHLHPALIRNYRLTLDWQQDLDMFNELYREIFFKEVWNHRELEDTTAIIFNILDNHPEIAAINRGLVNVYEEPEFRRLLDEITRIKEVRA